MKAKIRKTGEVVEIISYSSRVQRCDAVDYVSYIDSNGGEHDREPLNLYWDFEVIPAEEQTNATKDMCNILNNFVENNTKYSEQDCIMKAFEFYMHSGKASGLTSYEIIEQVKLLGGRLYSALQNNN